MNEKFDIQAYMTHGVETIVAESLKATLKNHFQKLFQRPSDWKEPFHQDSPANNPLYW